MKANRKWIITTFIMTFLLAMLFGGVSNVVIEKMNIILAIIVLVLVIAIGIVFDMIGMAIATCEEAPFHAKAAKKHSGAKEVIKLLKGKDKATNVCNDLIGDICGIISGSACALVSVKLSVLFNIDVVIVSLVLSAIVAMITVGGKAIGKGISMSSAENIMYMVGAVLHLINPVKETKKKEEESKNYRENVMIALKEFSAKNPGLKGDELLIAFRDSGSKYSSAYGDDEPFEFAHTL